MFKHVCAGSVRKAGQIHAPAKMSQAEIITWNAPETNYFKRLIQRFILFFLFVGFCFVLRGCLVGFLWCLFGFFLLLGAQNTWGYLLFQTKGVQEREQNLLFQQQSSY